MTDQTTRAAAEQIHDALDAAYHDRERGILDLTSDELAAALLAAGWTSPSPSPSGREAGGGA